MSDEELEEEKKFILNAVSQDERGNYLA